MKKKIIFSSSGNGGIAERVIGHLADELNTKESERVALLLATLCKNVKITISGKDEKNDTLSLEGLRLSVQVQGETIRLIADNVSQQEKELIITL